MLKLRIASAIVMGAILLAALAWLPAIGWICFVLGIVAVAAWEWAGFARLPAPSRIASAAILVVVSLWVMFWTGLLSAAPQRDQLTLVYAIAGAFWLIVAPVWIQRMPAHPRSWLIGLMGLLVLVSTSVALVDLRDHGIALLLGIMAIVWIADIAAYFAGHRFGRHRLAPRVSPGKTWEGAAGALIGVAAYGALGAMAVPWPWPTVVAGVVFLAIMSIVGDLYESALKRQAGLKDSGKILPGHGGLLDRIDAMLPVLPLAAILVLR